MKKLIVAVAATLLCAPVALAATTSSKGEASNTKTEGHRVIDATLASQCTALSQQFDQVEAAHKTDKNYQEALALSTEGSTMCSSNKQAAGVRYLQSAIKMIGLKANI